MKIILYATNKDGEGYVQKIGEHENWEDIEIRVGHYAPDIVISFEVEYEKDD